jgi:hypothetical protein
MLAALYETRILQPCQSVISGELKLPVQIATDNFRHYPFLIREHFG